MTDQQPPQNNPSINPQYYNPSRFVISAITRGMTTTVTTTADVNYFVGQEVRTNIPFPYGIQQINEQLSYVLSIPASNQVVLSIDSSKYDAFKPSPSNTTNVPQILPVGDINQGVQNTNGRTSQQTYIPGSFIDISPL